MQTGSPQNAYLIDTNQFQGNEDWAAIATAKIHGIYPVRGAIIRASQGLQRDTMMQSAAAGATQAGLYRGFYHAAAPQGAGNPNTIIESAHAQAQFFFHAVASVGGWTGRCLNPALDIEINPAGLSPAEYVQWVWLWIKKLDQLLGGPPLKPMLYLNENSWRTLLGGTTEFSDYPLWAASWGAVPADFGGWTEWTCWQYASAEPLAGVPSVTDYDQWHSPTLPDPIPSPASHSVPTTPTTMTPAPDAAGIPEQIQKLYRLVDIDLMARMASMQEYMKYVNANKP